MQHYPDPSKGLITRSFTSKKALDVVIIGGSLSGLMNGIAIKRLGHNVTILEQNLLTEQEGQAAGIALMEYSFPYMEKYDDLKPTPYAVKCTGVQILDSNLKIRLEFNRKMQMSSWNALYYRFRANFDAMKSSHYPSPPLEAEGHGNAIYNHGKQVVNIEYLGNEGIIVRFKDTINTSAPSEHMQADLVIAADGSTSRIRRLLQPELKHEYAGYVAWRGTILEEDVSEYTRGVLQLNTTLHSMKNSYIAIYTIPGENGSLEQGKRLINYIWYTIVEEKDLDAVMTDSEGHRHRQTLPIGKMRHEVWSKQREIASAMLPKALAELIHKTTQPFISAIVDIPIAKPSFFDGHLLFVGDALVTFRPHVACSTNQAFLNSMLMVKMLQGDIDLPTWEHHVADYANCTRLRSITWGSWYLEGWLSYFYTKAISIWADSASRISRVWRGPPPI